MYRFSHLAIAALLALYACNGNSVSEQGRAAGQNYLNNRNPLVAVPYIELPPGTIHPRGWLLEMLLRQKKGLTGQLDKVYGEVVGSRNGWLGGDGDGWERGPYWLDGLVPLAYILNDRDLISMVRPWIEWSIQNQRDDGYFGPVPFEVPPAPEPGLQKDMREDWWPKMVMLKVLKQYYQATGDERVIGLMTRYFRYQLDQLPITPLDHWTFWANRRGGDNLMVVYWLYNITGDKFLLDLAELIHKQTFPWTRIFLNENCTKQNSVDHLYPYNTGHKYPFNDTLIGKLCVPQWQSFHCVNLAQGIKEPVIYFQAHPDPVYLKAVKKAFADIEMYHGQAQGMYGADEPMHGNDPVRGVELCVIVEMMFSLENIFMITGQVEFADHLERLAFNALPSQALDDYSGRQYFQSANQVEIARAMHGFYEDENHGGTDLCYGILTGYPCCTCNMHQGWPKFTQNLFYATSDGGIAAINYAPSEASIFAGDRVEVNIVEETYYPFSSEIRFTINPEEELEFPFHVRIPGWCKSAQVSVNGQTWDDPLGGKICTIRREWKKGDVVILNFPMDITTSRWYMNSVAVERGPLVYALKIGEQWKQIKNADKWGDYWEVKAVTPWNYGLIQTVLSDPQSGFIVEESSNQPDYPWNPDNAPVIISTRAKLIPDWKIYNSVPGPMPHSGPRRDLASDPEIGITLIPYGCTTLRIAQFPVVE
ncbi:MAG TPA: beta-L-arabinofuranosidase domain-containing protein [Cyclobacteriaceae bacterium]|nr:beta-L-arabinofuranosidase domain-containing protein [Cyclobacteriaceae bacterium]